MHSPATLGYFSAPPGHFWEWDCGTAFGDEAAVWHDDPATVVLRAELNELLIKLAPSGLPPLGAILLVLAAAQENWEVDQMRCRIWSAALRFIGGKDQPAGVLGLWPEVSRGLDRIHHLPPDLRSGTAAKSRLLQIVFEDSAVRLPAEPSENVTAQFLETPSLQVFQQPTPGLNGIARLLRDLSVLEKIFRDWPADGLEQRLRTGIDGAIATQLDLPLNEPDTNAVPDVPADLLDALEQEGGELAQVAGLVRRLAAILHVPKPVARQEDLPVGGVSDITNRGDPSRLLMTELAWDDMTFAVRLAQGEALYTRRESPPAEPPPQRLVLLDAGIFMWGKPRLFALGAALALLRQKGAESTGGQVLTLAEGTFIPAGLDTVEQVRDQLGRLDPLPHVGRALIALLQEAPQLFNANTEVFLITSPAGLGPVARLAEWQALACRVPLHSLLVDRGGGLALARHSLAGSRLLSQARIDLDEMLGGTPAATVPASVALTSGTGLLPQFYRQRPWPLYHPSPPRREKAFSLGSLGFMGVSDANVVCWWRTGGDSGRVICPTMPTHDLSAVATDPEDDNIAFLLFDTNKWSETKLLVTRLNGKHEDAWLTLGSPAGFIRSVRFQSGALVVLQDDLAQAFSVHDGRVIASSRPNVDGASWFDGERFVPHGTPKRSTVVAGGASFARNTPKRHRITDIPSVGFDLSGGLVVQKEKGRMYRLEVSDKGALDWNIAPAARATFCPLAPMVLPDWPDHGLRQATFSDGRRVIHDPRGFLHVIDSGEHAQELSVVLVKGATAAWQRKGFFYGDPSLLWGEALGATNTLKGLFKTLLRGVPASKNTVSKRSK